MGQPMLFEVARKMRDLNAYDRVVINSSAGKDSMATLIEVVRLADEQGYDRSKIVVVHCDLGRIEWDGTIELAREQAEHYGLRFEIVRRPGGDLLDAIRDRGMFPGPKTRYCTSDFKRAQVHKLMTVLANELHGNIRSSKKNPSALGRPAKILNCLGFRAEEGDRGKLPQLERDEDASNITRRHVDRWLPIQSWNTEKVWTTIKASGLRYHNAYDYGMPRLSCAFCFFASRDALLISAEHNRELLDDYCEVEEEIGHTFTKDLPIVEIRKAYNDGERGDPEKCRSCPWAG